MLKIMQLLSLCVCAWLYIGTTFANSVMSEKASSTHPDEFRAALLIANENYRIRPLLGPIASTEALATILKTANFHVNIIINASQHDIVAALKTFALTLQQGGTGLIYFSGLVLPLNQQNLLVPIGIDTSTVNNFRAGVITLAHIIAKMQASKNRRNIIILDPVTDPAFLTPLNLQSRDLIPIEVPPGFFIAYPTTTILTTTNKAGVIGRYSNELMHQIWHANGKIEAVFQSAHAKLKQQMPGQINIWQDQSLLGGFFFDAIYQNKWNHAQLATVTKQQPPQSISNQQIIALYQRASAGNVAAQQTLEDLAKTGHTLAQTSLGNLYYSGLGVSKNYQSAFTWHQLAAQQGNASSQNMLGSMYEHGLGVEHNQQSAINWYQKAAIQGIMEAKKALVRLK